MTGTKRTRIIGITGRVGSGKSKVMDHLEQNYDCIVIKADEVARDLQSPGGACYEAVSELVGRDCLCHDGQLDRGKMALRIFNDGELLRKINAAVHPAVREEILKMIENAGEKDFVFIESAILIDSGLTDICDEIWNIRVDEDVRRKRLSLSRGYSDEKTDSILSKQMSEAKLEEACHISFDNSGSFEDTAGRIDEYLGRARIKKSGVRGL